jgi:RNA polymerase sigma-70 factor, ECF subfamily
MADAGSLIQSVRAGEPDALRAVYQAHGAALFRLAYRLMGNVPDAEDVVHDLFVGLPEALGRYDERGAFEPWLKTVAARLALMKLRVGRRRHEVDLEQASNGPVAGTDNAVDRIAVESALSALPEELRLVVMLKEVEGYSHAEVGRMLGINPVTSRVRLLRALRRLRRLLGGSR